MKATIKDRLPSQVKAVINEASSDRLKMFELSSFMVGPPLADVFERIDKSMEFFSIYIAKEYLDPDLWEDSRYVDKEKVQLCSRVEEEIRRYWWNRNREHLFTQ